MRITEFPILDEIKDEYTKYRQDGLSRGQAVDKILRSYACELTEGAEDDGPLFWVGLADAQYDLKELSEEVAKKGLSAINSIEQTDFAITPGDLKRRRERYALAPMPERAKVTKPKKFRCTWQMGDTFAYRLSGPYAEAAGLDGRYVLLRKVDELEFSDGRLLPVVTVTMWDDKNLPHNAEDFQRLPMLKLMRGRLGFPLSVYEYRVELIFKNTRELNRLLLEYLGNFKEVQMPDDEVIIRRSGVTLLTSPETIDRNCCSFWKRHNSYTGAIHK